MLETRAEAQTLSINDSKGDTRSVSLPVSVHYACWSMC